MPFTTATVVVSNQARRQFQGAYERMWSVELTVDPSSIAAGAEDSSNFTIPDILLGDHIISWGAGVNLTADADVQLHVSAANTLTIRISNLNGASALDLASSTWKVLIGRPAW